MIGFYDYTVILTYVGALAGMLGIVLAIEGNFFGTLLCMAASLLCDTLDGKVARAKKNRTLQQMQFGIQIDSLCDVLSFGAAPAVFFYCLGLRSIGDLILLGAYILCCVIRLGYFNVLAGEAEPGTKGDYHGLPVVCLTIMVPAVYVTSLFLPGWAFCWVMRLATAVFGFLYVLDFPVRKARVWQYIVMCLVFWVPIGILAAVG